MATEQHGVTTDDEVTVAAAQPRSAAQTITAGARLGRYLVIEAVGTGGMGLVLRAWDPELDRGVALKLLRDRDRPDAAVEARLLREGQAMARLTHPNVLPVFDVGVALLPGAPVLFIAMEYVEGETLRRWAKVPRSRDEILRAFVAAGRGLAAAHAAGIVHRDFKPDNVLVGHDGRVRVMDFGIARAADHGASSDVGTPHESREPVDDDALTRAGDVLGTPVYMAPEQHAGGNADARSDQYSFCVALFEVLVGRRPFRGTGAELRGSKQAGLRDRDPRLPAWLHRAIARGTAVDPADRFATMAELVAVLERGPRRRRAPWIATAIASIGGIAIATTWAGDQRCAASDELRGVWDDARRAEVEAAMLATTAPFAGTTWQRVAERLDGYATAWTDAHHEACLATAVHGTQSAETLDARMRCLNDRRHHLRAVVDVLADADMRLVEDAVRVVAALPAVDRCADEAYVLARVKPPADPDEAARADAIAAQIAESDALRAAGRYDDALAVARAAVDEAHALGHTPTLAHATDILGTVLGRMQDADALATIEEAYYLALAGGDDELAADVAVSLVYHLAQDLGRPDDALEWARHAEALYARLPSPPRRDHLENNIGVALMAKGDLAGARPHFERSTTSRRGSGDDLGIAFSLANLGAVAAMQHDDRAEGFLLEALAELERVLGPDHPDVAAALNNLAVVALERGDQDGALEYLRRALAVEQAALGPDSPHVATSIHNIGAVLHDKGDARRAQEHFRRALAIRERTLGTEHPSVGVSLSGLGDALTAEGRPGEAVPVLERAVRVLDQDGSVPVDAADARWSLGRALAQSGTRARGEALQRAACEVFAARGIAEERLAECGPATPSPARVHRRAR